MTKGISPLISVVLLIALVFAIGTIVSPWLFNLTTGVTNQTTHDVTQQITCQSAAYDFDSSYASHGISSNLTGTDDIINAKVVNTGTVNLHGFSFEIELNSSAGLDILQLTINTTSQKTLGVPLKPGQSAILKANITADLNGTIKELKVLNGVCPSNFIMQEL